MRILNLLFVCRFGTHPPKFPKRVGYVICHCVYRQELESVTARLQLQVCRSCEKKVDSHAGIAAGPAHITLGPRDQLPLSDRPRHTSAQSNRQQLQHRVEVPARIYFTTSVITRSHVLPAYGNVFSRVTLSVSL